jgi:hypothetical protein
VAISTIPEENWGDAGKLPLAMLLNAPDVYQAWSVLTQLYSVP